MKVSKKNRELIYQKYNGKCAYCGCELNVGWHVDELLPIRRNFEYNKNSGIFKSSGTCLYPERFNINNQMPACQSCNINKHSYSLEEFRNLILGYMKHLNEVNTQYKLAKRYGLINERIKPIVFYFERCGKQEQHNEK